MMNKKIILRELEKNKKEIKSFGVKKLGLFGSFLKGNNKKNSDIDLLVDFREASFDNYAQTLMLLEKILKRKIDLITEASLRPELAYVKKEAEYVGM